MTCGVTCDVLVRPLATGGTTAVGAPVVDRPPRRLPNSAGEGCFKCGDPGHMARQCTPSKDIRTCFVCGAPYSDHASRDCPNRPPELKPTGTYTVGTRILYVVDSKHCASLIREHITNLPGWPDVLLGLDVEWQVFSFATLPWLNHVSLSRCRLAMAEPRVFFTVGQGSGAAAAVPSAQAVCLRNMCIYCTCCSVYEWHSAGITGCTTIQSQTGGAFTKTPRLWFSSLAVPSRCYSTRTFSATTSSPQRCSRCWRNRGPSKVISL